MKKYTISAIVFSIAAAASVHATDYTVFERVPVSDYADSLRDGALAFDHKDYPRAFALNKRAACAGDKTSQELVGRMYLLGQGVTRDDLTGYAWIKLAAEVKFGSFSSLAHKLEDAITPAQRPQANAHADALRKLYGLAATNMSCRGESQHGGYVIDTVACVPQTDGGGMVLLRRCVDDATK